MAITWESPPSLCPMFQKLKVLGEGGSTITLLEEKEVPPRTLTISRSANRCWTGPLFYHPVTLKGRQQPLGG